MFYNDVFYFVKFKRGAPPIWSANARFMFDLVYIGYQFTTNMYAMNNDYNNYN